MLNVTLSLDKDVCTVLNSVSKSNVGYQKILISRLHIKPVIFPSLQAVNSDTEAFSCCFAVAVSVLLETRRMLLEGGIIH